MLIKHTYTFNIFWIPGDTNIRGNDSADRTANFACRVAIIMDNKCGEIDILSYIKKYIYNRKITYWNDYYHSHFNELNL